MIANKDRHATAVVRRRASRCGILATEAVHSCARHHGGGWGLVHSIVGEASAAEENVGAKQREKLKLS